MAIVKLQNQTISADDTYLLTPGNGNAVTLAVSDSFGGGTLTPGYINKSGTFVGFKDETEALVTFTASFQIKLDGGMSMKYALLVAGSTTPNILVEEYKHGR